MRFFLNKKTAGLISVIILVAITGLFLKNILAIRFIQDDAFTSFRYVKNFINGNGLVFNPGERVEGYTNFLWVMLLSTIMYLGKLFSLNWEIQNIAQVLSIAFSCAVILETYWLSKVISERETTPESLLPAFVRILENLTPAFLMAYFIPLLYWGVSAMETSMFVWLTLLSIIFYFKQSKSLPAGTRSLSVGGFVLISVLNSLLRPEGIIFFGLIMLHDFLTRFFGSRQEQFSRRIWESFTKKFLYEILFFAVPILIHVAFRMIYYGYPLPNTFYAKTDFTFEFIKRGWSYFAEFAESYLLFGLILFLPTVLFGSKERRKKISLLYYFTLGWIALVIFIGGDVLPVQRFFLPVMPIIFVLATKSIAALIDVIKLKNKMMLSLLSLLGFAALIVWGIAAYFASYPGMMNKRAYESGLVEKMKVYATWVDRQMEKDGHKLSVAMSTIGAFSYYSHVHVIDLVGLTDSYVAHHPREVKGINDELPVLWKERHYNAQYILSRKPDYIIFPAGAKPTAFAECAVFVQPEFKTKYYTQIFYSSEFNQLLPVFSLRKNGNALPKTQGGECNIGFLKHYINAENYFLEMIEKNNNALLKNVLSECDSVIALCPFRENDALTIKGYALYHAGQFALTGKFLAEAVDEDSSNSIAEFYLKNIYAKENKMRSVIRMMNEIKKYSPDALLNYFPDE